MEYYNYKNWENGDVITADSLNAIEKGLTLLTSDENKTSAQIAGIVDLFDGTLENIGSSAQAYMETGGINPATGANDDTVSATRTADKFTISSGKFVMFSRSGYAYNSKIKVYRYSTSNQYKGMFEWAYGLWFYVPYAEFIRVVDEGHPNDTASMNCTYADYKLKAKELRLASSSSGSTKEFRITVNDSGTITATEVT